jgi:hypothetical protein
MSGAQLCQSGKVGRPLSTVLANTQRVLQTDVSDKPKGLPPIGMKFAPPLRIT